MGRRAGEECPGSRLLEPAPRKTDRGPQGRQTEPGERERMPRDVDDRTKDLRSELGDIADERPEQSPPGPTISRTEPVCRRAHRAFEDRRPTIVERMGERGVRMDELDAARRQVDRGEEW